MLPIRTICALFLALATSLMATKQEFRFENHTVELMAEFNHWKGLSMSKQPNGIWTIKVSIPPGTYGSSSRKSRSTAFCRNRSAEAAT